MRTLVLCTILIATVLLCGAETLKIDNSETKVRVLQADANGLKLEFCFGSFDASPVEINGKTYQQLSVTDLPATYQKGEPELPFFARSIIIPAQAGLSIKLIESDAKEYPFIPVPSKGNFSRNTDPASVPYIFSDTYHSARSYPANTVETGEPYILRELRGAVIKAYPFVYDAQRKVLVVRHKMVVEVSFAGISDRNALPQQPVAVSREFEEIYANHFLNYEPTRYTSLAEAGKILVISYADYMDEMQPYVNWKIQKGILTQMVDVSTIGTTVAQIKAYIQAQYNLGGLAFVLLVGDAAQIPTLVGVFNGYTGGSDPSYSLLAGSDNYPDIYVGRFSAQTGEQVTTQVNKTIYYERDMAAADWLQKGVGIASAQGTGTGDQGEADYVHMNLLRTQLLGYMYTSVDQIYDTTGATAALVTTALNDGRGLVDYCGHGSLNSWGTTGFSSTHVDALQNDYKLPIIHSVACQNGNFVNYTCFAETWLRAKNAGNNNPRGAVAFYGSSIDQSWAPPMEAQDETVRLLTTSSKFTTGGLWYNGSCSMMDSYGTDGANIFLTWHIFGDPSLVVYAPAPQVTTNLRITRSGANFNLAWNASARASYYKIYRSTSATSTNWGPAIATTSQLNWTDTTTNGRFNYFYRVTASTTP